MGSEEIEGRPRLATAAVSEAFLTGSTEIGLARIRARLLDLTNRNRLLNFRHSKSSSLRFVDVPIDTVFERLSEGERVTILPVPQPGIHRSEFPAEKYAEEQGWNTSFDLRSGGNRNSAALQVSKAHKGAAMSVPTLHYQEHLDIVSRKISSAAKTAIEESGTNMLYLVFGFLEWYESNDSSKPHSAPLISVPVTLERVSGLSRTVESVIEYSSEDIETNLSLVEMMRLDFGLEIPLFEEDELPSAYFKKFASILDQKPHWRIRSQLTLGLLSFGKLLMYRDLDPKNWPKEESIAVHPLVRELFEGSKGTEMSFAEEFEIDAPDLQHEVPQLVRDADSSQHSALIHALRGKNLVIEGPPGTGKSQTITNLIAAALAKNKTVLFISEKLAALEVVRSRLDECGLGIFCLEVHSHKTKKGALLTDVSERYKAHRSFKDPAELNQQLTILEDKKQRLNAYAALMAKLISPLDRTIFDVLWARDHYLAAVQHRKSLLNPVGLNRALEYTQARLAQVEQQLSVYAEHFKRVFVVAPTLDKHPWVWVRKPLSFSEEERIVWLVTEFGRVLDHAESRCKLVTGFTDLVIPLSQKGMLQAAKVLQTVSRDQLELSKEIFPCCHESVTRASLRELIASVEQFQSTADTLSGSVANFAKLLQHCEDPALADSLAALKVWRLENERLVGEVRNLYQSSVAAIGLFTRGRDSFRALLEILGSSEAMTLQSASLLLKALSAIDSAPKECLHLRSPEFENQGFKKHFNDARHEARVIKNKEELSANRYDLAEAALHETSELVRCAEVIETASLFHRLFSPNYRRAIKTFRSISLSRRTSSAREMCRGLRSVADYRESRSRFDSSSSYRELIGPSFRGIETPWDELEELARWYERLFTVFPEHLPFNEPFRRLLLKTRTESLRGIIEQIGVSNAHRENFERFSTSLTDLVAIVPFQGSSSSLSSLDEVLEIGERFRSDLGAFVHLVDQATILDKVTLGDVPFVLESARNCKMAQESAQRKATSGPLLGRVPLAPTIDTKQLRTTLQFAEALVSHGISESGLRWVLSNEVDDRLNHLEQLIEEIVQAETELRNLAYDLGLLSGSSAWQPDAEGSWHRVGVVIEGSLKNVSELSPWSHFLRCQVQSEAAGLSNLTKNVEHTDLDPEELVPAFRFCFYNTLVRSIFAEHPGLSEIAGITQDMLRRQFAAADKAAISLFSQRAAAIIDKRLIPHGNKSGPVGTWTEMSLLHHEFNKQKRHIPLRQLMRRAANALLALKPCFMMGPLSVAQYLAPGTLKFDLVIMDEASQLKPEDAIGAMSRGGQVVIVGDPKQLPPTSFFQRVTSEEDADSESELRTAVEEGESILDVASTLFQPVRRLRWHYRSRHHSLIAFSNEEFYDRDLIIFPSAYNDEPALGVKYVFVPNGICENSRNPVEAGRVVQAVMEHMRDYPNETLGVVTLNFEQRELVEELLDGRLRDDPIAISFQQRMAAGHQSLFVKNLENVQGDERDVIFISTTYGPDAKGNQYNRFGPINSSNGHRRLNVLFTRSKKRTVVFSSLDPDRIHTTGSSPWGVRALKNYLLFAKTGVLQQADEGALQPTNDFERSVGSVLKKAGYQVAPQVGVAGFFIDLAVRHPAKPGAYLLGIECDGKSYHSGRSARDRDRLREEILVNLGWNIHHVWSTDWFKNREGEIKRLLQAIELLLRSDPEFTILQRKQAKAEALRGQLIDLRDSEIASAFPETPSELGLLAPRLLEAFLEKRPKTRDDWFRKIPQQDRTLVDSKQVGQYLDRVLRLIAESGT